MIDSTSPVIIDSIVFASQSIYLHYLAKKVLVKYEKNGTLSMYFVKLNNDLFLKKLPNYEKIKNTERRYLRNLSRAEVLDFA